MLTLAHIAEQTGYSQRRLRQLAERGVLKATLLGRTYAVEESVARAFMSSPRPARGRPNGSKNKPKAAAV